MEWSKNVLPMQEPPALRNREYVAMVDYIKVQGYYNTFRDDWLYNHCTSPILDTKYDKIDQRLFGNKLT